MDPFYVLIGERFDDGVIGALASLAHRFSAFIPRLVSHVALMTPHINLRQDATGRNVEFSLFPPTTPLLFLLRKT